MRSALAGLEEVLLGGDGARGVLDGPTAGD